MERQAVSPCLAGRARVPAPFFALTILLSAFLLFQVQPLIAKLILPWFGGSAAVWTSCMLFFQMALLAGYGYAHWLNGQTGSRQAWIHIGLLTVSLTALPIVPSAWWKPSSAEDPLLRILGLLTATVGLPYFLLSATSPLLQTWYSRANGGAMPYRFFALSNFGSMAGLLAYPVLVEPTLAGRQQAWMWSAAYVVFAIVCGTVAFRSRRMGSARMPIEAQRTAERPPAWSERVLWMALAACASALLLGVTNHLTQNVAAIPFLWVLPLSLYLLSFILCFDTDRWYRRALFARLGVIALAGIAYGISEENTITDLKGAVALFSVALFILFMLCHGELARRRPAPAYLTSFYLMVSVGGAFGGLFVGFAAPYLFNALYDLPVIVSVTAFLFLYLLWRGQGEGGGVESATFLDEPRDKAVLVAIVGSLVGYVLFRLVQAKWAHSTEFLNRPWDAAVLVLVPGTFVVYLLWRTRGSVNGNRIVFALALGVAFGITGFLTLDYWKALGHARVLGRNFYGALIVYDDGADNKIMGPFRVLRHGTIDHGEQFLWPANRAHATTYYAKGSGVGLAIQNLQRQGPMHVGLIGLGAGTLSTYARPTDRYRVYEINPLVLKIARSEFTFLAGHVSADNVVLGDARLSLESEAPQMFDLLVVDAFSGDAIPVHLLTQEAFRLYWRHMKPDGVLAVHVSNRYLSLGPVVALGAAGEGKTARIVVYVAGDRNGREELDSNWVLVTSRPGFFEQPELKAAKRIEPISGLRMWTDDYSNLYKILR